MTRTIPTNQRATLNDRNIRRIERVTRVHIFGREHVAAFADQGNVGSLPAEARGEGRVLARLPMRCERTAPSGPNATKSRLQEPAARAKTTTREGACVLLRAGTAPAQAPSPSRVVPVISISGSQHFSVSAFTPKAALTACNSGKHSDNQEAVAATTAIDDLLAQAQSVITRLDAAVKNKYARDPENRRVEQRLSHRQGGAEGEGGGTHARTAGSVSLGTARSTSYRDLQSDPAVLSFPP